MLIALDFLCLLCLWSCNECEIILTIPHIASKQSVRAAQLQWLWALVHTTEVQTIFSYITLIIA